MKTTNDPNVLLRNTQQLLKQQLQENSPAPEIAKAKEIKQVVVDQAAVFEQVSAGHLKGVAPLGTKATRGKTQLNASRGLKLGQRTANRIKTGIKLATLGAFMGLSLLSSPVAAQEAPSNPLMARVTMMTHNLDNAQARNVRTDFVMTNAESRNEGVIEFRIKDNKRNSDITKALLGGASVTLPAPWGVGDSGIGAEASVAKEGKFVVVRAQARGDAFTSMSTDPVLFVDGATSGRIDLDVKKMTVNENAFYHDISQQSLDRSNAQIASIADRLKYGIESGEIAPDSDEARGMQRMISTIQENVDVQTRQLGMDWTTKMSIGDGR